MKTSVIVAFSFTCLLICIIAGADPEPVLDTSGEIVRRGVNYYVKPPAHWIGSGGLTLINPNNTCPLYVVQERDPYFLLKPVPVTFIPLNVDEDEITTYTVLNIESIIVDPFTSHCNKSPVWSLIESDVPGVSFVIAGGEVSKVTRTFIHIDKIATDNYVLYFCKGICPGCRPICNPLGLFDAEDGYSHLALQNNELVRPYGFEFQRVNNKLQAI